MNIALILMVCTLPFITLVAMPGCKKQNSTLITDTGGGSADSTPKNYLALGDSYTIGESVAAEERFPHLTAALLRRDGISINDPEYIATTGWTTADLQRAIANKNLQNNYDFVSLLIGVNDQYQGMDTSGYRTRFTQLLQKGVQLAGGRASRVFVLSIPDYSATPFVPQNDKERVRKEIDDFNVINKAITQQHNVAYIDITAASRMAANDPSLLADDRLHYSAKEHLVWANMLAPVMKGVLQ